MMAYLVLHYDVKMEHGGFRPDNVFTALSIFPNPDAKVLFRKRPEAVPCAEQVCIVNLTKLTMRTNSKFRYSIVLCPEDTTFYYDCIAKRSHRMHQRFVDSWIVLGLPLVECRRKPLL